MPPAGNGLLIWTVMTLKNKAARFMIVSSACRSTQVK
jgi:hypothetical protein